MIKSRARTLVIALILLLSAQLLYFLNRDLGFFEPTPFFAEHMLGTVGFFLILGEMALAIGRPRIVCVLGVGCFILLSVYLFYSTQIIDFGAFLVSMRILLHRMVKLFDEFQIYK